LVTENSQKPAAGGFLFDCHF